MYKHIVELLKKNQLSLATAESCTGGLIAKQITDIPGSSQVFIGSLVTYSNAMKEKWLAVNRETIDTYGAVSEETVIEMLAGLGAQTDADILVAISGIAGPTGGSVEKPVGTVYIGVAGKEFRIIERYQFQGTRKAIRKQSADKAMEMIEFNICRSGE